MATKSGISFSATEPTRRSGGGMKRSARMTGFNRIGEVGIPTELRRQNSLGEILVHGRLVPLLPAPSQPLRRTLSTLTIIPATPSVAPPIHSRRNTVSDFDFDTPKKRQPFVAPTPHRSEDINTENEAPKKEYDPVGLGRRTRTKTGDEYTSLQDMLESSGFTDTRIITPISNLHSTKNAISSTYTTPSRKPRSYSTVYPPHSTNIRHSADAGNDSKGEENKILRSSASMGLLRGVMSIWSVPPPPPMPEITRTRVGREVEVSSSESGSIKTLMMDVRQRERAMSWIENVAKSSAVVPVSATASSATTYTFPTQSPPTATPPLSPSTSAVHASPPPTRPRSSTTPQPPVTPYRKFSPTTATVEITPRNVSQSPARSRSNTAPRIDSAHASLVGNQTELVTSHAYQSFSLGYTSLSPSSSGGRVEYDDLDDDAPEPNKTESVEGNGNWRSLLSFSKSLSNLRSTAMSFSSSSQSIKAKRYRSATPPPPVPPLPSAAVISTFSAIAFTPPPAPKSIPHFDPRPPATKRTANVNTALRGPRLLRKAVSSVALKPILTTSGTGRDIPFPR